MSKKTAELPSRYREAQARFPGVLSSYENFGKAIERAGTLSRREQRLVKLGLAFGARMEGAAHAAVRKALEAGLAPAEIEHAALLAMSTLGFPNGMMFLSWVEDVVESKRGKRKGARR